MPLELYMDVQVPATVTEGLRSRDVNVLTSQEDETREVDDELILQRATELNRVLFTQDRDFLRLASQWQQTGQRFPGVLYAPQIGSSIGRLIEDLKLIATCCLVEDVANRVYVPSIAVEFRVASCESRIFSPYC